MLNMYRLTIPEMNLGFSIFDELYINLQGREFPIPSLPLLDCGFFLFIFLFKMVATSTAFSAASGDIAYVSVQQFS